MKNLIIAILAGVLLFSVLIKEEKPQNTEIPDSYAIGYKDGYDKAALDIAEMQQN